MIRTTCLALFVAVLIGCGGESPKELVVGRWKPSGEAMGFELEVVCDGTLIAYAFGNKMPDKSWKLKEETDKGVTLAVRDPSGKEETMVFEFSDDNKAKLTMTSPDEDVLDTVINMVRTTGPRPKPMFPNP